MSKEFNERVQMDIACYECGSNTYLRVCIICRRPTCLSHMKDEMHMLSKLPDICLECAGEGNPLYMKATAALLEADSYFAAFYREKRKERDEAKAIIQRSIERDRKERHSHQNDADTSLMAGISEEEIRRAEERKKQDDYENDPYPDLVGHDH